MNFDNLNKTAGVSDITKFNIDIENAGVFDIARFNYDIKNAGVFDIQCSKV